MSKIDMDKLKIMNMIKDKEITPEEGFKLINGIKDNSKLITYQEKWIEKDIVIKEMDISLKDNTIIFDTNNELMELIRDYSLENNSSSQIILVLKGRSYKKISPNEYQINPNNQNDYYKLVASMKEDGLIPKNVLHFWSKNELRKDEKYISGSLNESIFSLFYLVQEMMKLKLEGKINLLYLYKGDFVKVQPQYAGIGGFLKTLKIENPTFECKSIGVKEIHNKEKVFEIIIEEFKEIGVGETEVHYDEFNKRYVRSYKPYEKVAKSVPTTKLKTDGVYIITGGAGEIGMIFAKHLISQVKCKVILTGRSELSEEKKQRIKEIEKGGSEIIYLKADISKKDDVERAILEIKKRYQKINGIIHSAGVLRDSFLVKKTKEEFDTVVASKVFGTIYIDEYTEKEKLDFFVLFSSIAATLGNIGQADYAYANSFMDYFAMKRADHVLNNKRFGKTISINWPLWKSGGMEIDIETVNWLKENMGIAPLSNENGMIAFEEALEAPLNQLVVFQGEKEKLRKIFSVEEKEMKKKNDFNQGEDNINSEVLRDKTTEYIKEILSVETKSPISKMKEEDDFEKFGIDSVMVMSLNRQLEKDFGELSKTLFYENNTIGELSGYLVNHYKDKVAEKFQPTQNHKDDEVLVDEEKIVEAKVNDLKANEPKVNESKELPRRRFINSTTEKSVETIIKEKNRSSEELTEDDIAIIGLSGRYPMASNLKEFWENLTQGKDCITEIPRDRWDYNDYFHPEKGKKGKSYSKWGGFVDDIDKFDPLFFNISPREAKYIDPQERLFLQTAWHTLEDGGYTRARLSEENVGVFVGVMFGHYQLYGPEMSSSHASVANRVSYYLNLNGPSIGLDTMCSSSLTAIHLAVESIRRGECDAAIAGGINLSIHPNKYILLSHNNFPSTDGKCRSFGDGGDGYVPGEGTGAILIKPLQKAIAHGDRIYGVLKGSAINHGGKTNGYSVPSPKAQAALISSVLKKTGLDPRTLGYIEAHGTGTALGDPIEITGLAKAFSEFTQDKNFCSIGSVKSNIGHLESAAGIAGITKVLLQMKYKQLVPSIHSKELNSNINFKETPFFVQQTLEDWKSVEINGIKYPRRAAVSSFGAGGSNAHIIIEEYIGTKEPKTSTNTEPQIFVLSAKNKLRLKQYGKDIISFLKNSEETLEDIAYTLQIGRESMEERVAILGNNKETIISKLDSFILDEKDIDELFTGNIKDDKEEETVHIENLESDYSNLARAWVNGSAVNWGIIQDVRSKHIISMPGYPFAKESYWTENLKDDSVVQYEDDNATNNKVGLLTNEVMYFNREWQLAQTKQSFEEEIMTDNILIFGKDQKNISEIEKVLRAENNKLVFVTRGESFEEINSFEYKLNPRNEEDYSKLFHKMNKNNIVLSSIINLWNYDDNSYDEENPQTEDSLNRSVIHLFHMVKAIAQLKVNSVNKVLNIFKIGDAPTNPFLESMEGFHKSIKLVLPNLKMSLIGVDKGTQLSNCIIAEMKAFTSLEQEIIYKNNEKYVSKIKEIQLNEEEKIEIKNKGVYLITGGAGGLGLVFVKHLAQLYGARIVITGRSPLSGEKEKKMNELLSQGHEILYMQGDVGKFEDMKRVIDQIKSKFGTLNGVIHGAGFADDKTVLEKNMNAFNSSLWPKVQGTIVLDQVTREEQLDFFVMFSSLSAVLGDFGQCDYAVGNKYLDAYVNIREDQREKGKRKGKTISIQWPLWREGGMHLGSEGEALYLQTSGMSYLETRAGIEAFHKILKSGKSTVMVISGHKGKIERFLGISNRSYHVAIRKDMVAKSIIKTAAQGNELVAIDKKIERELQGVASKLLCIDPDLMDVKDNLGDFGFDSISLKEYSDKISSMYGIELQPTVFFAHSNIKSLAAYLIEEFSEELKGNETAQLVENYDVEDEKEYEIDNTSISAGSKINKGSRGIDYLAPSYNEPIAVIGISGMYPGSKDMDELWNNLEAEKNMITEIPKDRWDYQDYYGEAADPNKRINTKWGGFIEDANKFDPKFFNISPREAELMDPQHRLFLQTVWKTIEDAGYKPSSLGGRNVGVFTGVQFTDYMDMLAGTDKIHPQAGTGNSHAVLCNRVSYFLNFKGPSEAIDTACSSSLVAIHRAVKSIQNGESELAIAGGVTVMASPETFLGTARLGVLSSDGKCKTFDKSANGYVRGEGVGAVLLKPMSKAIEDKDHIYAIIKGSVEGHGGRANSLTAPNSEAQAEMLVKAYEAAGIDPSSISYIEAHGTGTELGDPVEIQGLKKAFSDLEKKSGKASGRTNYCGISSIKTNIGHLEPASGIAGITKVILSMKNKKLPGTLHFKDMNPYIDLNNSPFYIVEKTKEWEKLLDENGESIHRIAGVSSFGFGGANAHVILEEYVSPNIEGYEYAEPQMIVLSAKNEIRLKAYASEMVRFFEIQIEQGLPEVKSNLWLKEIAYTLEAGREAMSERLAVVVASIDELIVKLKGYLEGKSDIENLYLGTASDSRQKSVQLVAGSEGKQFVSALMTNRKLEKIAQLWVCGGDVDLSLLYEDEKIRRHSLPTYPFARDIYWIPENHNSEGARPTNLSIANKLHPMIAANTSTLSKQNFTTILYGNEFFIEDHIVGGNKVLPGVAYIEMARGAGELSGLVNMNKVKDIIWTRPITVNDSPCEVNISLFPEEDFVTYEISTLDTEQNRIVHGQGKLVVENSGIYNAINSNTINSNAINGNAINSNAINSNVINNNAINNNAKNNAINNSADKKVSINEIKERCSKSLSKEECYTIFSNSGLEYGKTFRPISNMLIGEGEVLADLDLPDNLTDHMYDCVLHPSLMDGALQAVMGLNYDAESNETYLPFSIKEVEMLGLLKQRCLAYVTKEVASSKILKYNILILDEEGNVLVKIKEFSLRAIVGEASSKKEIASSNLLYFNSKWQEKMIPTIKEIDRSKKVLLLHNEENGIKEIADYFVGNYENTILVSKGEKFKQFSELRYEIDHSKLEDYNALFEALKTNNQMPTNIIHLLATNNEEIKDGSLNTSIYSVFNLSRSLTLQKPTEKMNILYAYNNENGQLLPYLTAVSGFSKTLCLENSKVAFKSVGLDSKADISSILTAELHSDASEVIYKEKVRRIKLIEEIEDNNLGTKDNNISIQDEGVYIITGGAGGLGILFAEYFAKNYKAKLIISGRSELDANKEEKLAGLRTYGGEVTYIKSDISKRKDVEKLINQAKKKYNHINGIIHCAGVIKDALLMNKSETEMEEVFGPKVYGTAYLDQATIDENLDFFALFSSISAVLGNPGQADYAYANSFMDNYAIYRSQLEKEEKRHGKSVSINWPLWREGGMKVDSQVERMLESRMGMKLLDTDKGVEAFTISLNTKVDQLIVVQGNRTEVTNALLNSKEKTINENSNEHPNEHSDEHSSEHSNKHSNEVFQEVTVNEEELLKKIQKELKETVSKILKIQENEIDLDADLSEFGFDSISFTEFSNELNDKYKLQLMPSIFYEHSTLLSFGRYLLEDCKDVFIKYYGDGLKAIKKDNQKEEIIVEEKRVRARYNLSKPLLINEFIRKESEPVAIIGISGIMPQSDNLVDFWNNLEAGKDLIKEIPSDRWDYNEFFGNPMTEPNKTNVKWGGFMNEVDKFDPLFFGISPREAELMDPQQRIFLQTVWKTIEDAGYKSKDISDTNTGVFVGVGTSDYNELLKDHEVEIQAQTSTGISHSVLANRISFILNLHGPSEPVDTACSSSLVAIHRAVEAIQLGNCDMAIAGGVNVIASPTLYISFSKAGMLCEDGRCKTFDKNANGYVRGEGTGAILLKPLSKAIEDCDHIYAVIKGSAVNHGGHVNSLTTPNPNAQADLISKAWKIAGVNPSTIGYIEAHGTGTSLGDPIEINGLKKAFDQLYKEWGITSQSQQCGVGSVKTNIGHLETASGIAGLLKVILSMKNKKIPASIHLTELNPYIKLEESPFYIVKNTKDWEQIGNEPRRAGVSSFGFGGTNAHIALEEYIQAEVKEVEEFEPQIIVLSAKNRKRLDNYVTELLKFIENASQKSNDGALNLLQNVENDLKKLAAEIIMVPANEINENEAMDEYGFDPVNITRFYDMVCEKFKIDLKAKINSGYTSLHNIGNELVTEHFEPLKNYYPIDLNTYIKTTPKVSLAEMSYTLQIGRDAMADRMAIVVSSIEELRERLCEYLDGKKDIKDLFISAAIDNKQKTLQLIDEEEGQEFIDILIQKGKTNKIAQLWVGGVEVDWTKVQKRGDTRRLSLPTYPFARDRYWIPEQDERKLLKAQKEKNKLHPMIDKNISTFKEQRFLTELTGKEFYFEDHVIGGNKILPGVVYLELARAAGELSSDEKVAKIKDVVWTRPITEDETGTKVSICLFPKNNFVDFEISTVDEAGNGKVHGQGKLVFEDNKSDTVKNAIVDIEAIKKSCNKNSSGEECYRRFIDAGFSYGNSFQTITKLYSNDQEALGLLTLPEQLKNNFNKFILHPSIMDGALQTVAGIGEDDKTTYLPFALGEVEIIGDLVEECYVYTTLSKSEAKVKKFKVEILDNKGNVLVRIKDFSLRALVKEQKEKAIKEESETIHYRVTWEESALDNHKTVDLVAKRFLVFDWGTKQFNSLKKKLSSKNNGFIIVKAGASFKKLSEEQYEINFSNSDNYMELIKDLSKNSNMPTHILHLLNTGDNEKHTDYNKQLTYELETSVYSMFNLCRSLIEEKPKDKVKIIYAFHNDSKKANPHYQGISGFLKTVALENSKIGFKTIELETKNCEEITNIFISEAEVNDLEVKYRDGKRWRKSIKELKDIDELTVGNHKTLESSTSLKDNGVYIITGGTGGLGLIFAKHIAENYSGTIVLSGRSDMDAKKSEELERLNEYSSKVVYMKANILIKEEVENLIAETKSRFGSIDGIIHCAGVVKDSYIINKTQDEMSEVFGPKIFGTNWLDEATKEEKLDFFVMFSSIAGVFGNAGQADYAYANSYMDNFAGMRNKLVGEGLRQGKSLSINWPLWRAGGMKVDSHTEKMLEATIGMKLLDTKIGIDGFTLGLHLDQPQLIVVNGYRNKINSIVHNTGEKEHSKVENIIEIDTEDLVNKVQEDLMEVVSKILKLQKEDLDLEGDLSEFGFDSITFTDFSNQLNEKYKLNIMPSIFYEHSTLSSFMEFALEEYRELILSYYDKDMKSTKKLLNDDNFNSEKPMVATSNRFINTIESPKIEPVAVIGMSGIMPQSENLEVFWDNLEAGKDLITEIPPDRWDWKEIYGNPMREANKTNIIWGGFMKEVDKFDPLFFGISPREAELMDPQQRIFLETVWRTIEDAGYKSTDISGTKTGVFVGVGTSDYNDVIKDSGIEIQAQTATGMAHCVLANRVSYLLNLHGPSEPIDTACSSSLVAIHRAVEAIQYGNCTMAIAGGINVITSPTLYISFSKAGMLCEDGRCKTFDKNANGYVRGEGSGAVLLKPLSKAIGDGDYIYGVIKGSAVNHGGHANSLTTPNPNAQAELIVTAWEKAEIDPSTVGYIEAHGTGTSLGDPIEINGLKKAFSELNSKWGNSIEEPHCAIGSVKTNIGHLETAAGISGLLKVLLAFKHKIIPANINLKKINPYIQLEGSPFYIINQSIQWEKIGNEPRRAGVSSFGFGGTNAHIVLEEYENNKQIETIYNEPSITVLSAKNNESLTTYAHDMVEFLERKIVKKEALNMKDMSFTSIYGRDAMEERVAILASSVEELKDKLEGFLSKDINVVGLFMGSTKANKKQRLVTKEKEEVNHLTLNKNLDEIAKLWVIGTEIDWSSICNTETSSKISLPTYPFSRERYWVTKTDSNENLQIEEQPNNDSELEILMALEAGEIDFEDAVMLMEEGLYE
ncbi:MAG: hypothetical protein CVU84_08035 [Firmicutes bacterium HGW-Firmicutes-1]|jgi:acyl transferase domain-containing protein/acyl carrier protein|nr:MAG: hypothetical protein CVU84_08035 [Firmicutes bacterium HGW-Firmicutes-1]